MPTRVPGYASAIVRVDLSRREVTTESLPEDQLRKWLGGTGFGVRYLYAEVPPGVAWNDPANRLTIATGPLAGTPAWGTGTISLVTKGPLTNGAGATQANGFFGSNLKLSGYDAIVLQGAAERWTYLYIEDGRVEFRDASHLLGLDTWDLEDAIKHECGLSGYNLSVFGIGPAGEHLVRWAAFAGDRGHVAGHNGVGAVLGSKKLKAIAVARGHGKVEVADVARLLKVAAAIQADILGDPWSRMIHDYGTLMSIQNLYPIGGLPIKNLTTNILPDPTQVGSYVGPSWRAHFQHQGHQCNACGMHHCHLMTIAQGRHAGHIVDEPEYEGISACGTVIGINNREETAWLATQVDRMGLDINEFGWVIGWVMECYEKGLLTKDELDGIEPTWGNAEAAYQLLRKLSHREGYIGNLLAEGVKRAAEARGGEALKCAVYTGKGSTPRGHDHRGRWEELIDTTLSDVGTMEVGPFVRQAEWGLPARVNTFHHEEVAQAVGRTSGRRTFEDCLGMCIFTTRSDVARLAELVEAVTGWSGFGRDEAKTVGLRANNLLRCFNLRHGIGPELEQPSARYGSTPVDGPARGQSVLAGWDGIVDVFYREMGWDPKTGRPLPETLRALGLGDVVADLWAIRA